MNVLESTSFIHRLFQICNLSQVQVEKKSWSTGRSKLLEVYTIAVVLFSIVILFTGIFAPVFQQPYSGDIGDAVDFIQLTGIRFAHVISILEALIRRNELQRLMQKIQEIDRIFEISLNTDIDNRKLRTKIVTYGFGMLGLYIASEVCILTTSVIGPKNDFVPFWFLYLVPLSICGLRYFQYLLFIVIIKRRFDKLVELLCLVDLLHKNKDKDNVPATIKLVKSLDQMCKPFNREGIDLSNLLVVRDLYNRLWELTILVNRCFGFSMLVNVGNDFLAVTSNCYWMFLNFQLNTSSYKDFFRIAGSAVWSVPHLFNVMTLAMMCQKTVESTLEIALSVHRIKIDVSNDNHNSLIEQFSLQLLHQKIHFTAFGFFTIDCSLLYTIVGATTTYLVILIQFHMSEQKNSITGVVPFIPVNGTF